MPVVISGTNGVSGVDGTASNPSYEGTDSNTGIFFPAADTIAFAEGGTEVARFDSSGRFGVGASSPLTNSLQTLQFDSGTINTALTATAYGVSTSINTRNAGGTAASPTASSSNPINFVGATTSDGTTFLNTVGVVGGIEGTPTAGSHPTFFAVSTTPSGSTTRAERMRIDSSGNLLVTNAAGLGYGTGAGGTVTQATNKSTTVTLNRPTGQITMNNAALGAGGAVAFSVLNSLVAASDVILLTGTNSPNTSNYRIEPFNVAAGVFGIRLTNVSGGSLSEAVVINFAIIKGATS
jgi:hypothetical protein